MKKFFLEMYDDWEKDRAVYFGSMAVLFFLIAIGIMLVAGLIKFAMAAPTAFAITMGVIIIVVLLAFLPAIIGKHLKANEDL
jgi:uncharacterized membrane protein (DUF485 family)